MKTVIFYTENAVFKFTKMEVKERLIVPESEYNPDELSQLLKLISIGGEESGYLKKERIHRCLEVRDTNVPPVTL